MNLQTHWNSFLNTSGSLENMVEFAGELRSGREIKGRLELTGAIDNLVLKNVSYGYDEVAVLKNIDLSVGRKETIAFVGESGSGKTTLVNLLAGLIQADAGEFLINGHDARECNIETYQRRIGYITQEPVIFSDSVFNNVTFWGAKTPENMERFWYVLKKASIYDFVYNLPQKEDTLLGNNGILLSGGQRQRISIARELYKDAQILIMDEATSSLDSQTEREIQMNLDSLKGEYTLLVVAHRLATVKNADKIVLLKAGRIEGVGRFDELKRTSTLFEKMVELQEV